MARANVARRNGDDFQARMFWLYAACLLDAHSPIIRVAYETGPKGIDDILIEYDPKEAPTDHAGCRIYRRHIQSKWHATAGVFGYAELIDPTFINAKRYSLLERVRNAQLAAAPDGRGCRFELITTWRIRDGDPLLDLIGKNTDAIDLDRLFDGTTDRSRMGGVRKLWREHLKIDDDALKRVARVFAVAETPESMMRLRERLDERFAAVGLKRVPAAASNFPYDGLTAALLAQGRIDFDRDSFRQMARSERILVEAAPAVTGLTIGIRSFMHPIDDLENRCERMLNLVPHFDGRYIREPTHWQDRVLPELSDFMLRAARESDRVRLVMDAHTSLAFAVGTLINVNSGRHVEIEQRTGGRRFWSMDDESVDSAWPKLVIEDEQLPGDGDEIAVAVSLTHDITTDVRAFVTRDLPQVGQIVHCRLEAGASARAIRCGSHAWQLAEAVVQHLTPKRTRGRRLTRVHFFLAGPNGFAFFLGQQQRAIIAATVYEWDLECVRGGGYSPGLSLGR
jgi:hypothetical protein